MRRTKSPPVPMAGIEYEIHHVPLEKSEQEPISVQIVRHSQPVAKAFDMHFVLELGYVYEGTIERHYPDWYTRIGPGGIWFCGMWEPHGVEILSGPAKILVLTISPQFLMNLRCQEIAHYDWMAPFLISPEFRPQPAENQKRAMADVASKFEENSRLHHPERRLWNRILLMEFLLLARTNWEPPAARQNKNPGNYAQLNPAIDRVLMSRRFVLEKSAAAACGLNRTRFAESFKDLMGMSFAKFSLRNRLSGARRQLCETNEPVKAIAAEWGFSDTSHLYRSFEAHYGCTPLQYRKNRTRSD